VGALETGREEQAQNKKQNLSKLDFKNNFRPWRGYSAWIEQVLNRPNWQKRMTQETEETVLALKHRNSLKTHPFHLVHVSGRYLRCEIAIAEFSFVDGVMKTYHAFINSCEIPVGYIFLATKRATETHLIPLPPDGFGSESDHLEIFNNIRLFVMGEDADETKAAASLYATRRYLAKRARAVYLHSRTRCWKSNTVRHDMPSSRPLSGKATSKNKCQERTLMQNEQMKEVRPEEDIPPLWLWSLRPLHKPRTPIELIFMCTIHSNICVTFRHHVAIS
jgi:hypothetical protein